jgi:hypothetical protein
VTDRCSLVNADTACSVEPFDDRTYPPTESIRFLPSNCEARSSPCHTPHGIACESRGAPRRAYQGSPIGVMSKVFGKTSCLVQLTYLILALECGRGPGEIHAWFFQSQVNHLPLSYSPKREMSGIFRPRSFADETDGALVRFYRTSGEFHAWFFPQIVQSRAHNHWNEGRDLWLSNLKPNH